MEKYSEGKFLEKYLNISLPLRLNLTPIQLLKKGFDKRREEELQKAFQEADKNKDGYLSIEEYMEVFHNHGMNISKDEASSIFNQTASEAADATFLAYLWEERR